MRKKKRKSDHLTRKAKRNAYPARSVYKLQEIDTRLRLLGRGRSVLDLGCAPGSWLLYASQRVGADGRVVGVDLGELNTECPDNARFVQADVMSVDPGEIKPEEGFDVVLSDMAPATTGDRFVDQERSFELVSRALEVAVACLKPGGAFVGKLFFSDRHGEMTKALRPHFGDVRTMRPRATRSTSKEVFVVGLGFGQKRSGDSTARRARRGHQGSRPPRG